MTNTLFDDFTTRELLLAQDVLSEWVMAEAKRTADDVGFGWEVQPDAPGRYDELCMAFERSRRTGDPLPVSGENQSSVIYTSPDVNVAMRYLHDVNHCRRGLSFSLPDELELGLWHLAELQAAGFWPHTSVWRLFHADLVGQATVMAFGRRFPENQAAFVEGCVRIGFDHGLLQELRSSP